jgi:hypothetical protein
LFDVRAVQLVVIDDVWSGYNPASPIAAVYELRRDANGGLSGEGRFSTSIATPQCVPIAIKSTTATAFLDAVADVDIVPGEYHPFCDHTDDFPKIEIALHVRSNGHDRGGVAVLYTESQGELHAPWCAFVRGQVFVVEGDAIGRSLRALSRSLKRAHLLRMARPGP